MKTKARSQETQEKPIPLAFLVVPQNKVDEKRGTELLCMFPGTTETSLWRAACPVSFANYFFPLSPYFGSCEQRKIIRGDQTFFVLKLPGEPPTSLTSHLKNSGEWSALLSIMKEQGLTGDKCLFLSIVGALSSSLMPDYLKEGEVPGH